MHALFVSYLKNPNGKRVACNTNNGAHLAVISPSQKEMLSESVMVEF